MGIVPAAPPSAAAMAGIRDLDAGQLARFMADMVAVGAAAGAEAAKNAVLASLGERADGTEDEPTTAHIGTQTDEVPDPLLAVAPVGDAGAGTSGPAAAEPAVPAGRPS